MRLLRQLSLVSLLVIAAAVPALAQDDVEGAKDHPMFSRLAGYYINEYSDQEFGSHEFTFGDTNERVEGHFWRITYKVKEGAKKAGPLQIVRNYVNALVAKGGEKLFEDSTEHWAQAFARLTKGGRKLWLQVESSDGGEWYELKVVDAGALNQQVEFSPGEMAAALNEKGSLALHGILFETGKATIKPESAKLLASVAEMLAADASLRVEIQGHTDNVGAKAANQKLSQDRATAVRDYLVSKHGIAAARLTAAGYGDTKPVADNGTEDGRAKNRRVELVKK